MYLRMKGLDMNIDMGEKVMGLSPAARGSAFSGDAEKRMIDILEFISYGGCGGRGGGDGGITTIPTTGQALRRVALKKPVWG